jgi:hypothetical protein
MEANEEVTFALSVLPDAPRLSIPRKTTAVRLAEQFARTAGVDLWYHEADHYTRLATFRASSPAPAS